MAPHSSTLAWKIPWMEEPGRLQSMGSLRVRQDWATSLSRIGEGNGNPLQCSCPENPRDGEPGGLPSMGSHRVGHDWSDLAVAVQSHGEGNGTPLQYSCLENPLDRGAWWAAVHGVDKNQTRLSDFTFTFMNWKWQPTPVFLPGESQGWRSLVGCQWAAWWAAIYGIAQSWTLLKWLSSSSTISTISQQYKVL